MEVSNINQMIILYQVWRGKQIKALAKSRATASKKKKN